MAPSATSSSAPAVQVFMLGGFRVLVHGRTLPSSAWRRKQARQLFKALLSRPQRRMLKEQAIELLWPEGDPGTGSAKLRPTLTALRHALEPVPILIADRDMLAVDPAADVWVDADRFAQALAHAESSPDPLPFLEHANALYTGDYLPEDVFEDWAEERREALRRAWAGLQRRLVRLADERHEPQRATVALERLVSADRCDEAAAAELIQRHAHAGQRVEALRVYERLAQALRELDLEPSNATLELRRRIAAAEATSDSSGARNAQQLSALLDPGATERSLAAKSKVSHSRSLPPEPTALLGRADELAHARAQLLRRDVRLLTLTGPGGSGKTRLAVALARELRGSFRDGVGFVDLSPIRDSSLVLLAIARALGLQEAGRTLIRDLLLDHLRERQALLVLDNFEHVLAAAPELADALADCPGITMLVTSRAPLHVRWEHQRSVPPLAVPRQAARDMEEIAQSPAVELFTERARAVDSGFALTPENWRAIAGLCSALDGLPLAIELAAARIRVLPPAAMLDRLSSRLALLEHGPRDAPERHRSLRAAIDWSFESLTVAERALLRRLSVFAGGATLDAIEQVCFTATDNSADVLNTLAALIDGSLVLAPAQSGASVRYDLLQTVREYCAEKLRDAAEEKQTQASHAQYFLHLAETAWPHLVGHDQRHWLEVLDQEHDNSRAALSWLLSGGDTDSGLRLSGVLWRFWWLRGHISEGQRWLDLALARGVDAPPWLRARVLEGAANLARVGGQLDRAALLAGEDVRICRGVNDAAGLAQALIGAGNVAFDQSEWETASDLYREALGLKRGLGEKRGIAMALHNLAEVDYRLDSDTFGPLAEESLAMFEEVGDRWGMALARNDLARVASRQGDYGRARTLYEQSLGLLAELGDRWSTAECLEELAALAHVEGEAVRAASLLGMSDALRESVGGPRNPSDQAKYDGLQSQLRTLLGDEAFSLAWGGLRDLPIEGVVALTARSAMPPGRLRAD